jgi:trimeric autotransporter adhesin
LDLRCLVAAALLAGGGWLMARPVLAASPTPGTIIQNQATGSFVDTSNGSTKVIESNLVQVTVAEVAGITLVSTGVDGQPVNGNTIYFRFVIANVGNDPTQFFIPDSPSSILNGGTQNGPIQVVEYDADGAGSTAPVDLTANNIIVPLLSSGRATGTLLNGVAGTNNGSVPASGIITVRVPVLVTGGVGNSVSVTLGDTNGRPSTQNQPYIASLISLLPKDLYTVDNSGVTNGDTNGDPINGDTAGHRQEASATGSIAVVAPLAQLSISGTVFEDVNYSGGSGRTLSVAQSSAVSSGFAAIDPASFLENNIGAEGTRVELYIKDTVGLLGYKFVVSTTTDQDGRFAFTSGLAANTDYRIRVLPATVISSRSGGSTTGLVPVQTYRVDGSNASQSPSAVTNEVGGHLPTATGDAPAANDALVGVDQAFSTQSLVWANVKTPLVPDVLNPPAVTGIDFGLNFDTITNTNDLGQGSLRQFILNSNALTNGNLAQAGLTAGKETSIFMISDGAAHNGLASGLPNQLSSYGAAVITLASTLPTISDSNTSIDGATQTTNVGNTNTGTLGTGGTVGTDAIALPLFNRPEIEIDGGQGVVTATGTADEIKNLAANVHLKVSGANSLIQDNLVGMKADGSIITALDSSAYAIEAGSGTNITVRHNFVRVNDSGIRTDGSGSGLLIEFNEVDAPPSGQTNTFEGILLIGGGNGYTVRNNLVKNMRGAGTELSFGGVLTNTLLENNTYLRNGYLTPGGTTPSTEPIGIVVYGAGPGTQIILSKNIVTQSGGPGIVVMSSQGVTITRNSTFANGINGSGLGIELDPVSRDPNSYGAANGVTANNGIVSAALPNNDIDYPIMTSASLSSGTLTVKGFVGSVSTGSSTFANATLEFFIADNTPANQNGEAILGDLKSLPHGEGRTYLGTCSADVNGLFNCSFVNAGTLGLTDASNITATATDTAGNTSEFSAPPSVNNPNVLLVKRITAVNGSSTNGGVVLNTYDPDPTYPYDKNVIQSGLTPPSSDKWPNTTGATNSTFLLGARNGGTTKTGDEIEYTIYFLSAGSGAAKNVTICDRIPRYQTFVFDAFNSLPTAPNTGTAASPGNRGIAVFQGSSTNPDTIYSYTNIGDGDAARYYPPGSTLPSACTQPALAEDNGSIVVNLGDVPNATNPGTPKESYGFLRFRAKVK